MSRSRAADYAGAAGRLPLERVAELGRGWVVQPKVDGCYARVHLDSCGRVERVLGRTGAPIGRELAGHLLGVLLGWPDSVLIGELEAHTEAGNRAAACRGWRALHLHDCARAAGRYLGREAYSARRDALWRMRSEVENLGPELAWRDSAHGARSRATGRWCPAVPRDWRLAPIVAQRSAGRASEAWAEWGPDAGGEGLVAVALAAPLGQRGAKLKVKRTDTLDGVVVSRGERALTVAWAGRLVTVAAGAPGDARIGVGDAVEIACEGFYERGDLPRFARLVRRRSDLGGRLPA